MKRFRRRSFGKPTQMTRTLEAAHLASLSKALQKMYNRQFVRALMSIPDIGEDSDFERVNDRREAPVVFD